VRYALHPQQRRDPDVLDDLQLIRFWAKVDKSGGPEACWPWTGSRTSRGYGRLKVGGRNGRVLRAHRVAWELTNGPIPPGFKVCHACDNPPCVRHLFLDTQAGNLADMVAKGRQAMGEQHWRTRLTAAQVNEIRRRCSGGESHTAIGRELDLDNSTISDIARGRSWASLL